MPEFKAFRGSRYDHSKVRMQNVVAPPYDVISADEREALYAKDSHNVIRLILNHDADPYQSAKSFFLKWLSDGTLVRENSDAFYVYYQTFSTPGIGDVTRTGVIGALALSKYGEGEVRAHERTLAGPKRDRLQLMHATRANLSPIFGLIDDPSQLFDHTLEIATVHPAMADITEKLSNGESVRHLFWKLDDPLAIERISSIVRGLPVTIADGHHRYETSLAFHESHPESLEAGYVMTYLSNIRGEGTVILPTHRALHDFEGFDPLAMLAKLREDYEIELHTSRESAFEVLERDHSAWLMIELADEPRWVLLRDRIKKSGTPLEQLPVWRLQEEILKHVIGLSQLAIDEKTNLFYPHTLQELDQMKASNLVQASFILRAVTPLEMLEVVERGDFMPQKSTFFYPKLLSGLVFHEFEIPA